MPGSSASLAIVGGRLLGVDRATALRVAGGRIAGIGGREVAEGAAEVVDARGGLVMPGFDDAHIHLRSGARQLADAQLFGLETPDEVFAAIRAHDAATAGGGWLLGRGWMYAVFPGGLPTRGQLDAIAPDRPAFLTCYDGHTAWANSAALRIAGIDRETQDPPFGHIERDAEGEPTGVLKEDAQLLVERHVPEPTDAEDRASVRQAMAALHRAGITAGQDAWVTLDDLDFWRRVHDDGELPLRARLALIMEPGQPLAEWRDRLEVYADAAFPLRGGDRLDAGILKGFVDGVIEARTASMLAPYEGDAGAGLPNWEPDDLSAFVAEADARGWQVELHAIGDRGVRLALDAFERAAARNGPWPGDPHGRGVPAGTHARRHRVEHVETVDAADIPRFGRLGVIASMQPFHADPSPNQIDVWAGNVGPERASRAWAWRSIRDAGGRLAFGSDWSVVPFDPFRALNSAVNRQTMDGRPEGGWLPEERLPLEAALEAYTAGSAWAAFADHRRGRLAVGMDADLAVLDRDLLAAGPSAIMGTGVALTVLDGRIVHRSEDTA
jgi:predicted amidohydrolase YtcJ